MSRSLVLLVVALFALLASGVVAIRPTHHLPRALVEVSSETCAAQGGQCINSAQTCDSGKFVKGQCNDDGDLCCKRAAAPAAAPTPAPAASRGFSRVPSTPAAAAESACEKQGGVCKANTNACATGYKAGLCPGAANIQCCGSSTASRAPATPSAPAAAASASSACEKDGGVCKSTKGTCATGFKKGMCPGAADIQCCGSRSSTAPATPATPASSASACEKQGGVCKSNKGTCATGFKKGMCQGAADIQCCGSSSSSSSSSHPTPTPSAPTPASSSGRPTFEKVRACYPQGETDLVKTRIGGQVNADWITNTCAIRMSHTLNCAGKKVPDLGAESIQGGAPNHWQYIFRVKQLDPQVQKLFGKGLTVRGTGAGGRGVDVSKFHGRKGIIKFDTTGAWDDASGHFDLWSGASMVETTHNNPETVKKYFGLALSVTLWELD